MHRQRFALMASSLAFGLLLTIVSAWGGALVHSSGSFTEWQPVDAGEARRIWRQRALHGWPEEPEDARRAARFAASLSNFSHDGDDMTRMLTWLLVTFDVGWPMTAFTATGHKAADGDLQWTSHLTVEIGGTTRVIPAGIVAEGFIVNTLFFAAIIWMLARGPYETRRRWREVLFGRCGHCGHPAGDSWSCGHCGYDLATAWGKARRAK